MPHHDPRGCPPVASQTTHLQVDRLARGQPNTTTTQPHRVPSLQLPRSGRAVRLLPQMQCSAHRGLAAADRAGETLLTHACLMTPVPSTLPHSYSPTGAADRIFGFSVRGDVDVPYSSSISEMPMLPNRPSLVICAARSADLAANQRGILSRLSGLYLLARDLEGKRSIPVGPLYLAIIRIESTAHITFQNTLRSVNSTFPEYR